jgi:hypothetical protein
MKRPIFIGTLLITMAGVGFLINTGIAQSQVWLPRQKCVRCDLTRIDLERRDLQNINFRGKVT